MISRRTFLAAAGAAAGLAAVGPWSHLPAADAIGRSPLPAPSESPFDTVVVAMLANASFDHMLGWLSGVRGRQRGLFYRDLTGGWHKTFEVLPSYDVCSIKDDPDHSWYGGLVQFDGGRNDGWLRTPPGRAPTDTFPIGYYTEPSVPVLGALAQNYRTLDGYFSSVMAGTYPNRLYAHAAQTDRDYDLNPPGFGLPGPIFKLATIPTIWDRLAAAGVSGRYYYTDLPFVGLWGQKYFPIIAPFQRFVSDAAAGTLPNVSFVDPRFVGVNPPDFLPTGQQFIADVFHAVRTSPQWDRAVLVVTCDDWGGFFDHVPPPKVHDDTNPATVDHTCNLETSCVAPPGLVPDYRQLGFRVPCVVVSPFAPAWPAYRSPYEHTSILRMIEWRWGLEPLTTRDRLARNLVEVLDFDRLNETPDSAIPYPAPFTPRPC